MVDRGVAIAVMGWPLASRWGLRVDIRNEPHRRDIEYESQKPATHDSYGQAERRNIDDDSVATAETRKTSPA
ncbi:hypothetical protein Harman_17370 [Haloarcula mannanilytica]|uniref:Uncharacterized protein n=1 Tax=Haloarcula mannanilytica TaxID=2509225 RepID=A0A4C2EHH6_9EURY|nr:hypothetical protein Harman_17370 [Haloarcula mannanilytica]